MNKWVVVTTLSLLTLMSAIVFSARQPISPPALYVFGDSLSDTGSVFQSSQGLSPSSPPYFQGRYSNGPVWVEYLADYLGVDRVHNAAWGGATTAGDRSDLVPGLLSQVQSFTQTQPPARANALYILWAGANDYLQGADDATVPVANIQTAIATLTRFGATHLLVANLPDLGQLPATRHTDRAASLTAFTQAHNLGLQRSLQHWQQQQPHLQITLMDAHALYDQAIAQPSTFGFTNVTQPCWSGSQPCDHPDRFLFWDSIHPTTQGHRILADTAKTVMVGWHGPRP